MVKWKSEIAVYWQGVVLLFLYKPFRSALTCLEVFFKQILCKRCQVKYGKVNAENLFVTRKKKCKKIFIHQAVMAVKV